MLQDLNQKEFHVKKWVIDLDSKTFSRYILLIDRLWQCHLQTLNYIHIIIKNLCVFFTDLKQPLMITLKKFVTSITQRRTLQSNYLN